MPVITMTKDDVTLIDWNILQLVDEDGTTVEFFIGYSTTDQLGRLSTPIEDFDEEAGTGATRSGSTYRLIGKPGRPHSDALYVLKIRIGVDTVKNLLSTPDWDERIGFRYPTA